MGLVDNRFEDNVVTTTVDSVINWARRSSIWPMQFGLACCAIEMMAVMDARHDLARFGAEVFRGTPRQSDLMIVAGTVVEKMAPIVKRLYDQMPDPKWVIAMGSCATCGGPYKTYAVTQGVDRARRNAGAAVDALVWMNIEHLGRLKRLLVLPRMDTVHRTDIDAGGILGADAWLANDIRHCPHCTARL